MTKEYYPRLCGGTFFTLVLQALRQRMGAREHYDGDSDGLSDPEVLVGLITVINPDYQNPGKEKLKGTTNNYKACKTSTGTYLPFDDEQVVSAFDETVRKDYQTALNGMIEFVNGFIDLSKTVHKDVNLVRALVDLIQQDGSINSEDEFYVGENGEKKKKAALGDLSRICFPSFLLGVWHYIVVNRADNSIGKDTYNVWCPENGRAQRKYSGKMGKGILEDLKTYNIDIEDEPMPEEEPVEPEIVEDVSRSNTTQQTVNNPIVFNFSFTQHGDNNTQVGHIEHYYKGKKGN